MTKKRTLKLVLILIPLIGLGLVLYPEISNLWNMRHSSKLIVKYDESVSEIDEETYTQQWQAAREFNRKLSEVRGHMLPPDMLEEYKSILDVSGLHVMGYLEIPKINVLLPIYHGTEPEVLQVGVGHLEWTSLPVGGVGTHCVLSGHRGLSTARLFSDLPQLQTGDVFYIRVLNEVLAYEVDQIRTVLPRDVEDLVPVAGRDYCTLVTCTPYGVNSHRLIVRGHRTGIEEKTEEVIIAAEAVRIEPYFVAAVLFGVIIVLMTVAVFIMTSSRVRKKKG